MDGDTEATETRLGKFQRGLGYLVWAFMGNRGVKLYLARGGNLRRKGYGHGYINGV